MTIRRSTVISDRALSEATIGKVCFGHDPGRPSTEKVLPPNSVVVSTLLLELGPRPVRAILHARCQNLPACAHLLETAGILDRVPELRGNR